MTYMYYLYLLLAVASSESISEVKKDTPGRQVSPAPRAASPVPVAIGAVTRVARNMVMTWQLFFS